MLEKRIRTGREQLEAVLGKRPRAKTLTESMIETERVAQRLSHREGGPQAPGPPGAHAARHRGPPALLPVPPRSYLSTMMRPAETPGSSGR